MGTIISITEEAVIALKAENEELREQLATALGRITWFENQFFGKKSEKLDPNQSELFEEGVEMGKPEPLPDAPEGDQEDDQEAGKSDAAKRDKPSRKGKSEVFPKNLAVKIVGVITPEEVLANPELYKKISERNHDLLHHTKPEVLWHRTVTEKYVLIDQKDAAPVSCPAPVPPIVGAAITPQFAAQLILAKYADHLPHYRQAGIWKREQDINLSRQTINKWTHAIAEHLKDVAKAIGRELRMSDVLQLDETPIDYLCSGNKKTKKGYYWVMRDPQTGAVYFHWETTRSKDGLKRTLGWDEETNSFDYNGTIQCDGYAAYISLQKEFKGITLGGCLTHMRRKFLNDESFTNLPWGKEFLGGIQQLYEIERGLKHANAPPDERMRIRQEQAKPLVHKLKQTLLSNQSQYRPKSMIGRAINYALGEWESFVRYLDDGKLEIDNNGVENAIRPTKLGAKNYLFIGSADAGTNSAVLYTLIENCKAIGLNPRIYLEYVIEAKNKEESEELTPAKVQAILFPDLAQGAA